MPAASINVRVGRLPGRIGEYALNGDRTVATALTTAGLDATGYEIRVQGAPATPATRLAEGDLVLLVKKIKGNSLAAEFVTVFVGRVPGPALVEFAMAGDEAIVATALALAGINLAPGEVVYVNDAQAELGTPISDSARIVVKERPAAPRPGPLAWDQTGKPTAVEPRPTPPAPVTVPDIASVPGTDPASLREEAERLLREAGELESGARAAQDSAAQKRISAEAHRAKAVAIEEASAALNAATERLESLGVLRPKGEGRWTDVRRLFGLL